MAMFALLHALLRDPNAAGPDGERPTDGRSRTRFSKAPMEAKPDMMTDLVVVEAVGHRPMQSMRRTDLRRIPISN